jgi:hypothetical protein
MGVVADIVEGVADVVGDVVEFVGDVVEDVVEVVVDVVDYVAENPEVALIAVAAPALLPSIGITGIAVQPVTAGLISASQGGDLEDIGKAALGSFAGAQIGGAVAGEVGTAIGAKGAETPIQTALANAVGGGAGGAAGAMAVGGDVGLSAITGAAGSAGASLARSGALSQFDIDETGKVAETIADVGEAAGRTVAGGNLSEELLQAGLSTITREGRAATKDLLTPTDADIQKEIEKAAGVEETTLSKIEDDITKALTDPNNTVQVAFQGPVTPDAINQIARNASLDLIETWKARAAADPKFLKELAQPQNLQAMRAAGMVDLAVAVSAMAALPAGAAGATLLAAGVTATEAARALRNAVQENEMLGGASPDLAFASAIIDAAAKPVDPTRAATVSQDNVLPKIEVVGKFEPEFTPEQYKSSVQRYIGDFADQRNVATPVTVEVDRVAKILNITTKQAAALKNSPIFDYLSNPSPEAKTIDIETLPLRERAILEYAAANNQGGVSLNEDFNVIIPGKTATAPTTQTARATQRFPKTETQTQTQTQTRTGTQTGTQTRTGTQTGTQTGTDTGTRTPEDIGTTPTLTGGDNVPTGRTPIASDRPVEELSGSELLESERNVMGEEGGQKGGEETQLAEKPLDLDQIEQDLIDLLSQTFPRTEPEIEGGFEPLDVSPATVGRRATPSSISPRVVGTSPVAAIVGEKEPIFGGEEDAQQSVWNTRSLRLRKALGG